MPDLNQPVDVLPQLQVSPGALPRHGRSGARKLDPKVQPGRRHDGVLLARWIGEILHQLNTGPASARHGGKE